MTRTEATFNAVADALIATEATDGTAVHVLASLMDKEGVPFVSAERYRDHAAIRELFATRGVTLLEPT